MRNRTNGSKALLALKLTFVVLMSVAILAQCGGGGESVGPGPPTPVPNAPADARRCYHSATLLPDGRVLVTGGYGQASGNQVSGPLSSAALYDPVTGTWSPTGSLNAPRVEFTATLLGSGKVLVAGGAVTSASQSAELYDPAAGTWSPTGNLRTGRAYHTATLLPNGQVLATGGFDESVSPPQPLSSAELYDPTIGTWSPTGNLQSPTAFHTGTLLLNGKVLIAGGNIGVGEAIYPISAELYDPATGNWSATGDLNNRYYWHTATLLPNGKVLLVGSLPGPSASKTTELYDPATGKWTVTGPLNSARLYHSATLLSNGKVLVLGGANPTSGVHNSAELYDPATEVWTPGPGLGVHRAGHTATLLPNGRILVAGGCNKSGILATSELYDPRA